VKGRFFYCLLLGGFLIAPVSLRGQERGDIQLWLTNADKSALFELQKPYLHFSMARRQESTN